MNARRVLVVGGGIAGLAAAHRALEIAAERGEPIEVTVVEASERLGGTIWTERIAGCLVEGGADSFITDKPWALALARRLGLDDRLIATRDQGRRASIVREGRLEPIPDGFMLLAPANLAAFFRSSLLTWSGKLRAAADLVLPRRPAGDDESLASFVRRRLGAEMLERVAQPLAGGIYTADPERLSIAATLPRFVELERRHRSVILGLRHAARERAPGSSDAGARYDLFASFAEGMQTLTDALARRMPEGAVRLGVRALALSRQNEEWRLTLADGKVMTGAAAILAVPSFATAELVASLDPELAAMLAGIRYASSATVTLGFASSDLVSPLEGFGFVVPAAERREIIAATFTSNKFDGRAPRGTTVIRVFCGGALGEAIVARDDDALEATARRELRELVGLTAPPCFTRVQRHFRAMPQYDVGHLDRVAVIEARVAAFGGVALAGAAYRGVGIPDCVHSGERAADSVLQRR